MKNKRIQITRQLAKFSSTTKALEDAGLTCEIRILKNEILEANRYLSQKLQVSLASPLIFFQRLRIVEGQPKTIETSYIPEELVPGMEQVQLNDRSFYQFLNDEYQIEIRKSEEEILLVKASENEKRLLELTDDEVLVLKGKTFDKSQRCIEYFEIAAVPDFYVFESGVSV
ncbi:UTRA domain-containing protein [Clostridiaceae bacterium DONG20-135]|uniref:UTRA domain-containing protein n=1 Tax=Copranaerobaculum intestinale TaxID=2692629 RepID=A0A6N8U322_9FIRM|nr:UTRA domain-containing protein [Copranaerobaculum intestinale]MXQ72340.1 UTRA domain-containing protein [Copranaerobaculum intestinale]